MGLLAQVIILALCVVNCLLAAEEGPFFLKAAKSVSRIGRSNPNKNENKNSNDENFEKFFLKASKSVPRIGRRGGNQGGFDNVSPSEEMGSKFTENTIKYPSSWSGTDIADLYEYNPELFSLPQLIQRNMEDSEALGDDPRVYNWENLKLKRFNPQMFLPLPENNREKLEPRFQAEMK